MKIKKFGILLILIVMAASMLGGCTSSAFYTFNVTTGDNVKVTLDTTKGYSLKENQGHFFVYDGENQILEGLFLTEEGFDEYDIDDPQITILEDDEKDTFSYYFFEYKDGSTVENNYLIWIFDSSTAVLLGGTSNRAETKAAFDRLNFSLDA